MLELFNGAKYSGGEVRLVGVERGDYAFRIFGCFRVDAKSFAEEIEKSLTFGVRALSRFVKTLLSRLKEVILFDDVDFVRYMRTLKMFRAEFLDRLSDKLGVDTFRRFVPGLPVRIPEY